MTARLAAILALCVSFLVTANAAGQPAAKTYYIFASWSRTAGGTDEAAAKKRASLEQANVIAVDDRIACALTPRAAISGVLGIYDKISASSFLTKIDLDREQMEYLGSLLGLYGHQRYVLAFSAQKGGQDRLWIIKTSRSLDAIAAAVRKAHLTPLSVRIEKSAMQIWIVDLGDKFGQRPKDLAAQLGGTASSEDGSGQIVGDEKDRAKAEAAYQSTIQGFEQQSKLRFSSSVTSDDWKEASSRTCSAELPE